MTRIIRHLAACVLAATVCLPAAASAQSAPREGFWFGIGGGAGRAEVTCDACDDEGGETGGSGYVKAGWTLSPRLLVGGELNVWTRREALGDSDAWLTMYNASATVTFYPSAAAGFFVKGGAGVAYLDTDVERRGSTVTIDLGSGPGVLVGAGYDIRLGRVALTPAVNYWRGHIGTIGGRGVEVASGWKQSIVDLTIGVTFP